tara:strand:- start:5281 stop:5715 length:435 start_codon:yes stop_codon:yes gene_type:complete
MTAHPSTEHTILVVDDEPVNIQLLWRKLEWEGLRVLSKLIANAWESYANSEKAERPVIIRDQLSDNEELVQFEVVDQGRGIDPEVEDNMFEPFISTKQTVGVGMGLTIARHAIRMLGGEIYIKSGEEGGVAASFTHPYNKEDSE